jgi:hypothetical protein
MIDTPKHEEVLAVWSHICGQIGEHCVLVLPNEKGVAVTAFRPTNERPLEECMEESIHTLLDTEEIVKECAWGALVAPSFVKQKATLFDLIADNDQLQQEYIAGDEGVREIVLVIVMEMDGPPMGLSFSQPLLEPLDEEPKVMMPGPMPLMLMNVMLHAAFPDEFKDE